MGLFFAFWVGAVLGSFLGVVVDRLPAGRSVVWGRSACGACGRCLEARDLVPILSQLMARGRCRFCGVVFSWWYGGLELFCGGVAVSWLTGWVSLAQALMMMMSGVLAIFDWRTHDFPLTVWVFFAGIIFVISPFQPGALVWLVLAGLAEIFPLKIGSGDMLWLATAAVTLSFLQLVWVLQLASVLGIGFYFLQRQKGEIAFVPWLMAGYGLVIFLQSL